MPRVPLVEKHRPNKLNEYVYPTDEVRSFVQRVVETGDIPNLLLSGSAGTGKTTLVRLLLNECNIEDLDILNLRKSEDKNVKTIRERVESFIQTFPIGKYKIVVIEEADTITPQAQEALRVPMEEYYENARFILTCNYPHKLIEPLKSRCQHIHVENLDKESALQRIIDICNMEGIKFTPEAIMSHFKAHYPDLRKMINSIDQFNVNGVLQEFDKSVAAGDSPFMEQWEQIWRSGELDQWKLLKLLVNMDDHEAVEAIRAVYSNIDRLPTEEMKKAAYMACASALADIPVSAVQRINLSAMIVRIFNS